MPTTILGISAYYHDSAAALVSAGELVAAAQEERFTRKKHDAGFPAQTVRYCLEQADRSLQEIDFIVFYDKPLVKFDRLVEAYLAFAPQGFRSFVATMPLWLKDKLFLKSTLKEELATVGQIQEKAGYPLKPGRCSRSSTDVPDRHRDELGKRRAMLRFCPTYDCSALSW